MSGSDRTGVARDYDGPVVIDYAPEADGEPDPGEIVWTWVPYEEDPSVGKDRPLVVIGRAGKSGDFVGLMLSSKDHQGDRGWVYLGSGAWDSEQRPSWVRADRLLAVGPQGCRREGGVLKPERFLRLIESLSSSR